MANHNELGEWGERIAREYLMTRGYTLLEQNLHVGHKEIDIVALKGSTMAFIEVKTRQSDLQQAVEAVDSKKMRRMIKAADSILASFTMPFEYRFDIIAVIGSPETSHEVHHITDAFMPGLG